MKLAAAATLSLLGGSVAAAAQQAPVATLPGPSSATTTTKAVTPTTLAPTTSTAPTTAPPTTTASPTTAPETKIIFLPSPEATKIPGAVTTTTSVGAPSRIPSLSPGQVDAVLRDQQRSGASSTSALVEALKPLLALGMTAQEALALGMGQFPVLGLANWTDDWLDFREGPPPHLHQGTDVFAAFDTPVRAPVDGIVRFEDAGLGGKGAFVTTPDGTYYYMAHLSSFSREVGNGAAVKQGQVVGYNGDSGNAQGGPPHVHLEVHPGGGAAVNPKPILDGWLAAAAARVPELLASFQPKTADEAVDLPAGVPQILVATGLTRRFSTPSRPVPTGHRPPPDFKRAVLEPLTPAALVSLFTP